MARNDIMSTPGRNVGVEFLMLRGDIGPGARSQGCECLAGYFGAGAGPVGYGRTDGQNTKTIRAKVFGGTALVGKNHRDSAGEGFGHDHAEGFVGRRMNKNIDAAEKFLRVGAPEKLDGRL